LNKDTSENKDRKVSYTQIFKIRTNLKSKDSTEAERICLNPEFVLYCGYRLTANTHSLQRKVTGFQKIQRFIQKCKLLFATNNLQSVVTLLDITTQSKHIYDFDRNDNRKHMIKKMFLQSRHRFVGCWGPLEAKSNR